MATKRMFDRAIIDTDRFMDLSMTAKAIYFLLGMEADDEGFVSYKKVMRVHGGNEDDIKVLIAKQFVILFDSGVVVITDWNKNNWLDTRRTKPTEYQKEKKLLSLTKNNEYVLSNGLASIEENRVEEIAGGVPSAQIFSLKEEIETMMKSERREIRIIGWFINEKHISLKNKEQLSTTIKRHLRPAKLLIPFEVPQIKNAADNADRQIGNKWTLETLYKLLTK